ncbi:hypothetical protein T03_8598 [Trichinella britovi]|uniref:Uncharacterized protein n=1 Tax=Trichinella britovi TaxID=45882 RepID=A0A0V1CBF3_TRIBR|nr:hypothetical protein T03_8598 [Trichinella britovi]
MTKVSSAGDLIAAKQCQRSTQQHRIHLQNKEKAPLALSSYKIDSSSLDEHQVQFVSAKKIYREITANLEEWEKGKRTNIADVSFVFVDNAESRGKKPSAVEKQEEEEKRGKLEEEQ